ncbi:MAG: DUF488 domain-containing protein [Planctomycetota bacterium]
MLFTVGHSNRALDEFVQLVLGHGVEEVVDVRAYPHSRRHSHFDREHMASELRHAGLGYVWRGRVLGGFRRLGHSESPHLALAPGFAAYADHMQTDEFVSAVKALAWQSENRRMALMCAEKDWRDCHRFLIADHLVKICGVAVEHILDSDTVEPHKVHEAARIQAGHLVYDLERGQGRLF